MKKILVFILTLVAGTSALAVTTQEACNRNLLFIGTKRTADIPTLNALRSGFHSLNLSVPPIEDVSLTSRNAGRAMPFWTASSIVIRSNYTEYDLQCAKALNTFIVNWVKQVTGHDIPNLVIKTEVQARPVPLYQLEWHTDLSDVVRALEAAQEESRIIRY